MSYPPLKDTLRSDSHDDIRLSESSALDPTLKTEQDEEEFDLIRRYEDFSTVGM